ncbi:MAG: hypothetical protein R3F21_18065 [Myxococcota bacterium]
MSSIRTAVFLAALIGAATTVGRAQTVGMYGEYHESNGIIVDIPQNPPIAPCVPPPLIVAPPPHPTVMGAQSFQHLDLRPAGVDDARCHDREWHVNFTTMQPGVFNKPRIGNRGARIIPGGVDVGDPFTIPPFAFEQHLGLQVGIVLQNVTRQIDTDFVAAMPGIDRLGPDPGPSPTHAGSYTIKTPGQLIPAPALTRRFSAGNWNAPGNGQNNGKPGTAFAARLAADTTHFNTANGGNERVEVRYRSGPNQFGGTMALLLDGSAREYLVGLAASGMVPATFKPNAGTRPIPGGDVDPGFRIRNAGGWDLTATGFQNAGRVKAFYGGLNPANAFTPMGDPRVAADCTVPNQALPVGCNEINGFDTFMAGSFTTMLGLPVGGTIALLPKATSVKHMFALTTGTVSVVRVASRPLQGGHFSDTLTGMGYDTVRIGGSPLGGVQRNVGLVAGSYAVRTESNSFGIVGMQIDTQLLGVNLKFVPEPGATIALASGLGLIARLARRRRTQEPDPRWPARRRAPIHRLSRRCARSP